MNIKSISIYSHSRSAILAQTLLTTLCITVSTPAIAVTLITERSDFGFNDNLDFASLGQVFNPTDPSSFLPNNFTATSENGLEIGFNIPPTDDPAITPPFIFQTGFPPSGIPTNFADGDFILFTGLDPRFFPSPGNSNPIIIDFANPVTAAGTQIAVDDTFSFTANVSAFDAANNLLGSFSAPGTSSTNLDNSALFIGVANDEANISRLVYSSNISDRAIGINNISIATEIASEQIPEPSNFLGLLMLTMAGISYKSSQKSDRTKI